MTDNEMFNRYFNGGFYSLHYLLEFSCNNSETLYFVNNNENVIFNDKIYNAVGFEYSPPDTQGKGATLKITGVDNSLIEFIENANDDFRLDVIGVIAENGEIQKLKQYSHFYGSVSYGENMELNFELSSDDRLDMTFPPYKFDTDINRGNA
jgi:hypothetical protein